MLIRCISDNVALITRHVKNTFYAQLRCCEHLQSAHILQGIDYERKKSICKKKHGRISCPAE